MAKGSQAQLEDRIEAETQEVGRSLWSRLQHRQPSIFDRRWWDDRILSWAMADESVKVQMFRFVDVLPMLRGSAAVARHLQEYFEEVRENLPRVARLGLDVAQPDSLPGRALAYNARVNARRMAERFIAGTSVEEVLQSVGRLRRDGMGFTLDLLGEAVISESEAEGYQQRYLELIDGLGPVVNQWDENPQIDCDQFGPMPRVNVSIKLSALTSHFSPIDPEGTAAAVGERLRPLLRRARQLDACVHVDMEHYSYKDLTLRIFRDVLMEEEFRDFPDIGVVIQAYLPEAGRDLDELLAWAQQRGTGIWVRLVKGAYWDYETVAAGMKNWPIPVYRQKWESDASFERHTRFLMQHHEWLRPQIASHNLRSLSHAVACASLFDVPRAAWEVQMLYGMGAEHARLFVERGHRVRIYTPFGELIPGMAYLVRRLLENTSNDSFLRHSLAEEASCEELFMNPVETGKTAPPPAEPPQPEFVNEPLSDFSRDDVREAMQTAIDDVESELGRHCAPVINGHTIETREQLVSRCPSHPDVVVGTAGSASPEQALEAIDAARRAYRHWSRVEPGYRAEYLELAAAEIRNRRFELAAWEVWECGKTWAEADADVAEAIDFCMYYAQEMRRLAEPRQCDLPGEENATTYRPRGVAVVIAPWNFPLAILTGMTAAALVAGNAVVMKPAEQSPVLASLLMDIFRDVAIPAGVVNFLPGEGEEIGPVLTGSSEVDLIAFTGSRAVGLEIVRTAGETQPEQSSVKRVVAEMGGKNAIIVDDDADLDEAVVGVLHSAFGYAGQKCSACSRAIVLDDVYDRFTERLVEAATSLKTGPAELPGSDLGPVIDEEAYRRICDTIDVATREHTVLLEGTPAELEEGWYIGPHIFGDVAPDSELAQEEVFGPVLAVIRASDFSDAIDIANGTDYALTAGVFSRSPANLKRCRQELHAGNIYLNRGTTGALVHRQPFGGYRMSGIGSKTGGPDYLLQFLIPVTVTENTLRRGFAPAPDDEK